MTLSEVDKNDKHNLTNISFKPSKTSQQETKSYCAIFSPTLPSLIEIKQYVGVALCGFTAWGTSWFLFEESVAPGGYLFNLVGVIIAGYITGHTLEKYTSLNAMVGMTIVGALYRNFGPPNIFNNRIADGIDFHFRRIYPVIILTKGPLSWNWEYIKNNSLKVFSLATLPWIVECLSTAFFTHLLLDFPWYWGLHLGAILASVSPAVVVPTVNAHNSRGFGTKKQIALLVGNAGGLDTAFTEGMFGVISSVIFYPASLTYRIVKAALAVFLGIGLGISWGVLVDFIPDHVDLYAPIIRSLLIFSGGFLLTYGCGYFGWGGTSGVAIMVCAGAAATRWARRDWPINKNPVADIYRVLWLIFEPMLFTLSGYYLDVSQMTLEELGLILSSIFAALFFRLITTLLVCLANELSVKESLFIAITWIPKAIVEAVLVRAASDSLWEEASFHDKRIAIQHSNIIVIAIIMTTSMGSVLTTIMGPVLLSTDSKVIPEVINETDTTAPKQSTLARRKSLPSSLQTIDIQ